MEREPEAQQEPFLQHPGRDPRIADGAEEDRVAGPEFFEDRVGEDLARAKEELGAEVEGPGLEVEPVAAGDLIENLQTLPDHLRPDPVSRNHTNRLQGFLPTTVDATTRPDRTL